MRRAEAEEEAEEEEEEEEEDEGEEDAAVSEGFLSDDGADVCVTVGVSLVPVSSSTSCCLRRSYSV